MHHDSHRMFPEGICLNLIEEFDKVLDGKPYSVLPLVRLCETNDQVSQNLNDNSSARHSAITNLAERMLRRGADKAMPDQQVISRPGLDADTVNDEGEHILCRPANESRAALSKATSNKGVKVINTYKIYDKNCLISI